MTCCCSLDVAWIAVAVEMNHWLTAAPTAPAVEEPAVAAPVAPVEIEAPAVETPEPASVIDLAAAEAAEEDASIEVIPSDGIVVAGGTDTSAAAGGREPRHLGHNPLGAWMIVALLTVGMLAAGAGLCRCGRQAAPGCGPISAAPP